MPYMVAAGRLPQQAMKRVLTVQFVVAVGEDEHGWQVGNPPDEVTQRVQRRIVSPVNVFNNQNGQVPGPGQFRAQGGEHTVAFAAVRHGAAQLGSHAAREAAAPGRPVVLRDGSTVLIRQVQSADAPLLADGFARLSTRACQLRFLSPKNELSPGELRYFTDVDHHDHEALGALNHADGRGVGIARYVRDADDPQAAEIAVTVIDDWQGRGPRHRTGGSAV